LTTWLVIVAAVALLGGACSDNDDDGEARSSATTTDASMADAPTTSTTLPTATPAATDVEYATTSDAQRLDLYLPKGSAPYPLVILVHGGGWFTGDKANEWMLGAIPVLADAGYAVAAINYRLVEEATFPAQILDAKAAVRWLRAHAAELGLDPNRFAAVGESAGAHLAALLGTSAGEAALDDPALGNAGVSSAVQAVVDFYGPVDLVAADAQLRENPACAASARPPEQPDPASSDLLGGPPAEMAELAATANPITYVSSAREIAPFFIAHGDADCVVPYQGSVALHEAIEAAVGPGRSQLTIVPGSGHYDQFDYASQVPAALAFLDATIG